ncbi:hypothetical protein ColTof4_01420 [Colletotrichum tofieldiae]|nr:hypothetical protein ColTof3_08677 [Colletotrichum tofieldiae]GKT68997.1 hypothetical protein ColTof4_01420 [Colletotrichum tofieldiae]
MAERRAASSMTVTFERLVAVRWSSIDEIDMSQCEGQKPKAPFNERGVLDGDGAVHVTTKHA